MSGSKQHFIPQFLLRQFAHERSANQFQVRVHRADRANLSPVQDVAAQNHFYGNPKIAPDLDDAITKSETALAITLRDLLKLDTIEPQQVGDLLAHLTLRGAYVRKFVDAVGTDMFALLRTANSDAGYMRRSLGIDEPELTGPLRESFDQKYNDFRREGLLGGVSRHQFRTIMHAAIREKFDDMFPDLRDQFQILVKVMQEAVDDTFLADAHNRALRKAPGNDVVASAYAVFNWQKLHIEDRSLILPDCVAVGRQVDGIFSSLIGIDVDQIDLIYFPISASSALVGFKGDAPRPDIINLNEIAASSSWEFFVSHPSSQSAMALQEKIQSIARRQIADLVADAMNDIAAT